MSNPFVRYVFVTLLAISCHQIHTLDQAEVTTLLIDCDHQSTWQNTEINGQFTNIEPNSILNVQCYNVKSNVSFIILQVHSFKNELTLYKDVISANTSFRGTNIGMHSPNYPNAAHNFSIANFNNVTTQVYISIHAYNISAPIPGGCNMVGPVEIDPTMSVSVNDNTLIRLSAEPARFDNTHTCGLEVLRPQAFVQHTFYRLYLEEHNDDEMVYFDSIRKMLTVEKILTYADEVPEMMVARTPLLKLFGAFPGTGVIYVVVVTTNFGSAVYVPTHTSSCSVTDGNKDCGMNGHIFSHIMYAVMLFVGLFICFFGHHFLKTEMFAMGTIAGTVVSYVVVARWTSLKYEEMAYATTASGMVCGALWCFLWWCYSVPVASVLLVSLLLGAITACNFMLMLPDGISLLTLDANYWCVFFIIVFAVATLSTFVVLEGNMFSCAMLGAYASLCPVDIYIGSNVRYIVVNVIRRAVVKDYNWANVRPPYQWRDQLIMFLWITLTIFGFLFQKYRHGNRAPFPPPIRNQGGRQNYLTIPATHSANERTPLLHA